MTLMVLSVYKIQEIKQATESRLSANVFCLSRGSRVGCERRLQRQSSRACSTMWKQRNQFATSVFDLAHVTL